MEASESDIAKQKIEQEAREQKAREEAPPEQPQEPTHKVVQVSCGNCKSQFEFPIERNVVSFGFDCTNCSAHNEVEVPQ